MSRPVSTSWSPGPRGPGRDSTGEEALPGLNDGCHAPVTRTLGYDPRTLVFRYDEFAGGDNPVRDRAAGSRAAPHLGSQAQAPTIKVIMVRLRLWALHSSARLAQLRAHEQTGRAVVISLDSGPVAAVCRGRGGRLILLGASFLTCSPAFRARVDWPVS